MGGVRYNIKYTTYRQKRYCWHRRFTCGRCFHALHNPLLKDIFRVRTVHLSFLKFYHILTQRASCIKKKVFFPGFTKFRCDLLPLNLQYTEKSDISTPVSIVIIKNFQLKSCWLRNLGKVIGFQWYEVCFAREPGQNQTRMQNFVANHVISLHDVSQIQYHFTAFCVASWKLVIMFLKPLITWLYCKLNKLKSNSYRKKIVFVLSQKFDFVSVL